MGEAASAGGRGPTITHNGVSLELAPWDVDMIQQLELWLENKAWDGVERQRHRCSEAEYERRLGIVSRDVAARKYAYLSKAYVEATQSLDGQKYITFLMLCPKNPNKGVTPELAAEICEQNLALLRAKMDSMDADPNSQSPAPGAAAGETATAPQDPPAQESPATATP